MLNRDERRALLFLSAVAAAGGLLRVVRAPADAPGAPLVAPQLAAGDIARQAALSARAAELARPLMPGEVVDVDRAEAAELERLPRIGPALAQRIADDRAANGPFGSLEGLSRVPGIGPGVLKGLERKTSFSGLPRASVSDRGPGVSGAAPPPGGAGPAAVRASPSRAVCPALPLSLNGAGERELRCLPGIGAAFAGRIVSYRTAHGPFREVKDLQQVPGLGPARVARLAPHLTVP